jgi:hypothetical protein
MPPAGGGHVYHFHASGREASPEPAPSGCEEKVPGSYRQQAKVVGSRDARESKNCWFKYPLTAVSPSVAPAVQHKPQPAGAGSNS